MTQPDWAAARGHPSSPYDRVGSSLPNLALVKSQVKETHTLLFTNDSHTAIGGQVHHCMYYVVGYHT